MGAREYFGNIAFVEFSGRMVSNAQYATGERGFEQRSFFFYKYIHISDSANKHP